MSGIIQRAKRSSRCRRNEAWLEARYERNWRPKRRMARLRGDECRRGPAALIPASRKGRVVERSRCMNGSPGSAECSPQFYRPSWPDFERRLRNSARVVAPRQRFTVCLGFQGVERHATEYGGGTGASFDPAGSWSCGRRRKPTVIVRQGNRNPRKGRHGACPGDQRRPCGARIRSIAVPPEGTRRPILSISSLRPARGC